MELVQRVETGLALAGQQAALFVLNLAEQTKCSPTLWAYDGAKVRMAYLVTGDTDSARAMVMGQLEKDYAGFKCVTTVIEADVQDPSGARGPALEVGVHLPGTDARLTFVLPFSDGPRFDRGFHLVERVGVPDALGLEPIARALFLNLDNAARAEPGSALDGIPRTVTESSPGVVLSRDASLQPLEFLSAGVGAEARKKPVELTPAVRRLATLAPYAAFVLVAASDGRIDPEEVQVFVSGLGRLTHPVLGRLVAICPVGAQTAIERVTTEPGLAIRSLAAAGILFAREGGREELVKLLREVAEVGGVSAEEQGALAALDRALDAGELATRGADPFADLGSDSIDAWFAEAAFAPFAGFLLVAAADGKVDQAEVRVFLERLIAVKHPLLLAMLTASDVPMPSRIEHLTRDRGLIRRSLQAAGRIFAANPLGDAGRTAFLELLRLVAAADGKVGPEEERVLRRVEALLDPVGASPRARLRVAVRGGLALGAVVAVWQVAAALTHVEGGFVPVAIGLQVVVLAATLFLTAALGARYPHQVVLGTITSVVGGLLIALSGLVVSTLLMSGTDPAGAAAGLIGTVSTGLVGSLLIGLVIRRR